MTKFEVRNNIAYASQVNTMGTTGTTADHLQLEVLGEGSERSQDDDLPTPGCEGKAV